ncbi:MAG: EAL domain-containing protein [Geodermatophilaceae bacterium]|nr:EAL domain-containing protein [Geodermatophilaceae bacterium]
MTAGDAARFASVSLVVLRAGVVTWLNDAARALVAAHGGAWDGSSSPVAALGGIQPGLGRAPMRWPSPRGGTRWWQVTCTVLDDAGRAFLYEINDETARYDADGRDLGPPTAQWRLSRLEAMAGMGSWVWNVPDDSIEWSEALLTLFGFPPAATLDYPTFRALVHPDDLAMVEARLAEAIRTLQAFNYTYRMFLADGTTERVFECYAEVYADAAGVPVRLFGSARDITEQHRARADLAYLAEHDPLTGIANRRSITAWLVDCAADPHDAALLLIDIDNFKDINDLRGHAMGDQVIQRVARRIAATIGPDAQLGRLGGDEFAVVVPRCSPPGSVELAERLCADVAVASMIVEAPALRVTVSIGVATVARGQDAEASLAQADLALYEAKNSGRNRARLFAPDHYHQAARRVSLLERVGAAVDAGAMSLDAQPIVDLGTGRAARYQLLIRLRDGLEPALSPTEFLPDAERTDLVLRLDRWALEHAVQTLASPRGRATDLHVEVNVSARSLEDADLGSFILDRLKEAEVDPHRFGLEITETTAIGGRYAVRVLADRLTEAGCGFSLGDFGAGFGSFSSLKQLPFTEVKIAGEFVRQLDADPVDRALVTAVVGVAAQLGMRTVATSVDRPELVTPLRALGVDAGQGAHFGRPRPLSQLLRRL